MSQLSRELKKDGIYSNAVKHSFWYGFCVLAMFCILLTSMPVEVSAAGATFTVNSMTDSVDIHPGDGICKDSTNSCTLRAAIMENNASAGGSLIVVPTGTYTLSLAGASENGAATGDLDITKSVTIIGSNGDFNGSASSTIIQAGTNSTNGIDRVFDVNPLNPATTNMGDVTFEALTIRNGKAASNSDGYGGGAIAADTGTGAATLKIYNSIIETNSAANSYGGGLYLSGPAGGSIILDKTIIRGNTSLERGGGVYVEGDVNLAINNSTIDSNSLDVATTHGYGGGLAILSATPAGGTVSISNSTFSRNAATNGSGGGIYLNSPAKLVNTTISGNNAITSGGGLMTSFFSGDVALTNVTIYNNAIMDGNGGGIYLEAGLPTLNNTIVAGNLKSSVANDIIANPDLSLVLLSNANLNNLIGTGGSAGLAEAYGNMVGKSNPGILTLANNGGITETNALQTNSIAINAGSNTVVSTAIFGAAPYYDQRGYGHPRKFNSIVDIGAFEYGPSDNADLSGLSLSSGTLSPSFTTSKIAYTASVTNGVTSLSITPTVVESTATVKVNGNAGTSGQASTVNLNVGSNTVTIVVTAEDGSQKEYKVIVTRAASSNADLSVLSVSSGTLSPSFVSGTIGYTASVANGVTNLSITPTVVESTATLTVNGNAGTSGQASTVNLNVGSNTVTIVVTAEDGSHKDYTVIVTRAASSNADLSALSVSSGTLSPSFTPGTTAYTASVANGVNSLSITPTVVESTATVKVNGNAGTSGQASTVSLNVGSNTVTIVVTAEDGSQKEYKVIVTRAASSNADLSALSVSSGTLSPSFTPGTTAYTASVANGVNSLLITPTVVESTATVKVNGNAGISGQASTVSLNVGSNTVTIVVTAEDGSHKDYTVIVTRAASSNADLSALSVSLGTLSPSFTPSTTAYTASVANGVTSLSITPTVVESTATVKVNGNAGISGQASIVNLNVGSNTVTIVVTAEDGSHKDYTVIVTRAASSNADLSALSLSSGTLSPSFTPGTTAYTASVANGVNSLSITATVVESTATVKVNGNAGTSGQASTVSLNVGSNTVTIVVTAEDGSQKAYTVIVTRAASSNADLSALSLSSGTLSPSFTPGTTAYTASVANGVNSLLITPTVVESTATVKVNGNAGTSGQASTVNLNVGSNTVTIVVTAEDGRQKEYKVIVTRAASSNADLSALSVSSGTLSPSFTPGTTAYTVSVTNGVTSLSITPTVVESTATVKVNGNVGTSGQASTVSLNVGSNTVTIVVTAEDGSQKAYTVIVIRAASSNADLSALSLSSGSGTLSPSFVSGTNVYTASVTNGVTSLSITPTVVESTATVKVNGNVGTSGQASTVNLNVGSNTVTIVVTAEDGSHKEYTVIVTRAASSNADLSALSLSSGTLSPSFTPGTTAYTASVANGVTSFSITPTVVESTATVKVNGNAGTSGQASTVSLNVGSNTVTVVVTAEDGSHKNYTIVVTRAEASSNANLTSLQVHVGAEPVTLSQENPNQSIYKAIVSETVKEVTLKAVTEDINYAALTVNDVTYQQGSTVTVPLNLSGSSTILVKVTAQDGTIKVYTIQIVKTSELVVTSATTHLGGKSISLEFIDALNSMSLNSNHFIVKINGLTQSVTEATYSTLNKKIIILKLGSAIVHGGDIVTVDISQGAVFKLNGDTNNLITGIMVQNAADLLKSELRALGQAGEGIHINEVIKWMLSVNKRDLDGDGIFNNSDLSLLLEQIDPYS